MAILTTEQQVLLSDHMPTDGGRDYVEIDLLTVLAFLYRWRTWLFASSLAGVAIAGALVATNHFVARDTEVPQHLPSNNKSGPEDRLSFFYSLTASKPIDAESQVESLKTLLKMPENLLLLSENMASSSVLLDFEFPYVKASADIAPPLEVTHAASFVMALINKMISSYNEHYADTISKLERAETTDALELGGIKFQAIRLIDKNLALSPTLTKELIKELSPVITGYPSPEAFTALVSAIPEKTQAKYDLVFAYKNKFNEIKIRKAEALALKKQLGVDVVPHLPLLRPIQSSEISNFPLHKLLANKPPMPVTPVIAPPPVQALTSSFKQLATGGMLGLIFGIALSLTWNFSRRFGTKIRKLAGE